MAAHGERFGVDEMKNKYTKPLLALILALVMLCASSLADFSELGEMNDYYIEKYTEAAKKYGRLRYGMVDKAVKVVKQQLKDLGYYNNRIDENYGKTLIKASRTFCQQLRIDGGGEGISPLFQAILADKDNVPYAISPAINIYTYSRYGDETVYTPFTFQQVSKAKAGVSVGINGTIVSVVNQNTKQYYVVRMAGGDSNLVYVEYEPAPRTTRFQAGVRVAVFGKVNGGGSYEYDGMGDTRVVIVGDRVGYLE